MEAEPDAPPPPEPTLSPEPDIPAHEHRSWRADMISALGGSVSFGRFLSEPLDWAKRSAFAHDRYLDDATRHSRPGSVAAKKAFFEAHYATKKRKTQGHDAAAGAGGALDAAYGAAAATSSSTESYCMTDEPPTETDEMSAGTEEPDAADCSGGGVGREPPTQMAEELQAVADAVASSCSVDAAADEACHRNADAPVAEDAQAGYQSQEKHDLCNGDPSPLHDAVEKQPLKEIPIANQDITDSVKKRRLHVSSLLQKPAKPSSPPSGKKKGQSPSSAKRRWPLHSAKENTSPAGTDTSNQTPTSVPKKRSALSALHMSMSFTRSEAGSVALIKRNVGTTIAERISQLESASRPVGNTRPEEFRPPTKTFSQALPQTAPKTPQVDQQRSSHVMRVKEKLFGSASPSLHQKTSITKERERKFNNEPGYKESRQSFCFKARPLPNFYRKNKQAKDSSQQTVQETSDLLNSDHLLIDVCHARQASKGVPKEKQMCCFPIRKLY